MPHQLVEAGGLVKGQSGRCQQGVLHPAGAVRVGGVSPGQGRHSIPLVVAEAALVIAFLVNWL